MPSEFVNERLVDFDDPANANAMVAALAKVKSELGRDYPLRIGGDKVNTEAKITSLDPSNAARPNCSNSNQIRATTCIPTTFLLLPLCLAESSLSSPRTVP